MNCGFCGEALDSSNVSKDSDLCLNCYRRIFENPADRGKTSEYQAIPQETSDKFRLLCFKSFVVGVLSFIISSTFPFFILLVSHGVGIDPISRRKLLLPSLILILPIAFISTYIKARFYLKVNHASSTVSRKVYGFCLLVLLILGGSGLFWRFTHWYILSAYDLDLLWVVDFLIISILSANQEYAFAPFFIGFSTWAIFACYIFGGR